MVTAVIAIYHHEHPQSLGSYANFLRHRRLTISGPVGSAYPGNLVISLFGLFFLILSGRSSLSAYRQRRGSTKPRSGASDAGFAVFAFLASMFAFYAVWAHR